MYWIDTTEVVRKSAQAIGNVLNSARRGIVDENTEKLLKARFINQSEKTYPHDASHMYAENFPPVVRNKTVLKNLSGQVYSIEVSDKIPDDCRYPFFVIHVEQNEKQTSARDLTKFLQLKIGTDVNRQYRYSRSLY